MKHTHARARARALWLRARVYTFLRACVSRKWVRAFPSIASLPSSEYPLEYPVSTLVPYQSKPFSLAASTHIHVWVYKYLYICERGAQSALPIWAMLSDSARSPCALVLGGTMRDTHEVLSDGPMSAPPSTPHSAARVPPAVPLPVPPTVPREYPKSTPGVPTGTVAPTATPTTAAPTWAPTTGSRLRLRLPITFIGVLPGCLADAIDKQAVLRALAGTQGVLRVLRVLRPDSCLSCRPRQRQAEQMAREWKSGVPREYPKCL